MSQDKQSLSHEAVREITDEEIRAIAEREFNPAYEENTQTITYLTRVVRAVLALKREPNAAARVVDQTGEGPQGDTVSPPAPAAPDVASMVEQLRQWGPALKIGAAIPRAQVGDLMVQAANLLAKLGQGLACPRPQIMGEHACKDRTQCWEPCGDLGHHKEYAQLSPGASDE